MGGEGVLKTGCRMVSCETAAHLRHTPQAMMSGSSVSSMIAI